MRIYSTLSGRIRTSDGMRQFWTASGSVSGLLLTALIWVSDNIKTKEVQLTATGTNWIFTEVIGA